MIGTLMKGNIPGASDPWPIVWDESRVTHGILTTMSPCGEKEMDFLDRQLLTATSNMVMLVAQQTDDLLTLEPPRYSFELTIDCFAAGRLYLEATGRVSQNL